ncbi:hypothetical protein QWI17_01610, partial [Gilvimarinus sp. SDUM040013]|uniref:hypothetical protein n=1 Tax=Gilvimarinus gilvus TaxID=3058038 RepID=UPI002671742F
MSLKEVASQNPITGGEIRSFDNSFGSFFSRNLNQQGFGTGTVIDHNVDEPESIPSLEYVEYLKENDERSQFVLGLVQRYGTQEHTHECKTLLEKA